MRYITRIILAVMAAIIFALPAQATEFMDMDISLGRQIVARTLCKDPVEVNYVSRVRENVYLFSVFYANKQARFFRGRVQRHDSHTG